MGLTRGTSGRAGRAPRSYQLALEHGHGLSGEHDPVAGMAHADRAAPRGCLVRGHLRAAEPLAPKRRQGAVGGAGHRVLPDPRPRAHEAPHAPPTPPAPTPPPHASTPLP